MDTLTQSLLDRHAAACALKQRFDEPVAREAMQRWLRAIGAQECDIVVVRDSASAARGAWDASAASAAWDASAARAAWDASAARAARAASAAWAARAASAAWDASAAWAASAARAARAASAARAAWDASWWTTTAVGCAANRDADELARWLPLLEAFEAGVHLFWCAEKTVYISPPPPVLRVDERRLLHCEDGPAALLFEDAPLYFIHGVLVPAAVVMRPDTITPTLIDGEWNTEVQRVMIERFGWDRYIAQNAGETVDHDERWGTLLRTRAGLVLRVVNRSPEPDGSFRNYILPVSDRCEPLPDPAEPDGQLGDPQDLTALNAVASTFGMRGEEYARMLAAES